MRKWDVEIGMDVLTRYRTVARVIGILPRHIEIFDGHRKLKVHHSDLIKEYNGGRDNGNGNRSDNGSPKVLEPPEQ